MDVLQLIALIVVASSRNHNLTPSFREHLLGQHFTEKRKFETFFIWYIFYNEIYNEKSWYATMILSDASIYIINN